MKKLYVGFVALNLLLSSCWMVKPCVSDCDSKGSKDSIISYLGEVKRQISSNLGEIDEFKTLDSLELGYKPGTIIDINGNTVIADVTSCFPDIRKSEDRQEINISENREPLNIDVGIEGRVFDRLGLNLGFNTNSRIKLSFTELKIERVDYFNIIQSMKNNPDKNLCLNVLPISNKNMIEKIVYISGLKIEAENGSEIKANIKGVINDQINGRVGGKVTFNRNIASINLNTPIPVAIKYFPNENYQEILKILNNSININTIKNLKDKIFSLRNEIYKKREPKYNQNPKEHVKDLIDFLRSLKNNYNDIYLLINTIKNSSNISHLPDEIESFYDSNAFERRILDLQTIINDGSRTPSTEYILQHELETIDKETKKADEFIKQLTGLNVVSEVSSNNQMLVYSKNNNSGIYSISLNNNKIQRISDSGIFPNISQKMNKIIFVGDNSIGLYKMDIDGRNRERLLDTFSLYPYISPDASIFYFTKREDGKTDEIWQCTINCNNPQRITSAPLNSGKGSPSLSPNYDKLAFGVNEGNKYFDFRGNVNLYVLDLRTNQLNKITDFTNKAIFSPVWSNRADKIAFRLYDYATNNYDICVVNSNGSGQIKNLTNGRGINNSPISWSNDDSEITFTSTRNGQLALYKIQVDNNGTNNETRLSDL